jgi:Skp family chaperone for outer membrane proteins
MAAAQHSSRFRHQIQALLLGCLFTFAGAGSEHYQARAQAQVADFAILIVDRDRVLRDSIPARRLAEQEQSDRIALGQELEQLRNDLQAEEAEIAVLRETAGREEFEARVRLFDQRVREARQTSQQKGEALQARFADARRKLSAALDPVLFDVMNEHGASLIFDSRNVIAARSGANVTDEVLARFDALADTVFPQLLAPTDVPEPSGD